jgi:site-specific DNA recombinase
MSDSTPAETGGDEPAAGEPATITLTLLWAAPSLAAVKGIVHEPVAKSMKPENRDALLAAIAKARQWIDDLRLGRTTTLAEIAAREGVGERYIRLLAPLAFMAPRLVAAIADGTAPADLTVTGLAKSVSSARSQGEIDLAIGSDRTCNRWPEEVARGEDCGRRFPHKRASSFR